MQRHGMVFKVREGKAGEYKAAHEQVPEAIRQALQDCHIRNNSVFLIDHLLFMYFEYTGDDFDADWQRYGSHPAVREWFSRMGALLEPYQRPMPKTAWSPMEEVFFNP